VIYTIIPVHNRKNFTKDCLISLRNQTYKNHKTIIIDDGSTDGTKEMLEKEFPEVIVLHGDGTLFWTAAMNRGVRHALKLGADFIFTLNNDTLAAPDLLEKMMYWQLRTPNALLGALDIDATSRKPYYGGEIINWKWSKARFLLDELEEEERHGLHEVSLFHARGLLVPRKVYETIGLYEEKKLPHYMADNDFTLMAKRHGFKIYCNYDACLYTYPEEGGDHKIKKNKTLKNYYNHLFSIKGGANLKNYTIYVFRNCPKKDIPLALLSGYVRRFAGFWLK
jgi:GT2 family glycosyltransferase